MEKNKFEIAVEVQCSEIEAKSKKWNEKVKRLEDR